MGRRLCLVFYFGIAVSTAVAQEKPGNWPGVPPRFVTVSRINPQQGEMDLTQVTVRFVREEVVTRVEQDGKLEEVTRTVLRPVYEESFAARVTLDSANISEAGGSKL